MHSNLLSVQEVKELDLVVYLESLGHSPQKIRNNDYWYLSPLRPEKEPSFKVNRRLNAWYDHSLGRGGNLVDFGLLYHGCSVRELLQKIGPFFSLHPPKSSSLLAENSTESHIKVVHSEKLLHPALYRYLQERKIAVAVAKQYTEEVHFELAGKSFYAIGFRNNQGGFELRNRYFKGSSSPKDSTFIERKGATELAVVEGFFSFLSYQTHFQHKPQSLTNFLVLNSLSFFKKNLALMDQYPRVRLFLDNDRAGDECTRYALKASQRFTDERGLYKGWKDFNEWLRSHEQRQGQHLKIGR
jgi:hypothetical protein